MSIRLLVSEDLAKIESIQAVSPQASQWNASDYRGLLNHSGRGWVATANPPLPEELLGFIFIRHAADEMEILNLAVLPAYRRQGIARELLNASLLWTAADGVRAVWLEVRASNSSAISFYQSRGFRAAGSRPHYYSQPAEDALLLTTAIP